MPTKWNMNELNRHITDRVEESQTLDYKCAAALGRTDSKKKEIRKDVSAMANSAGGTIIYGLCEYQDEDRKHLPEKLDPIDRVEYSREWLEDIVNDIRPKISGLLIHPVSVGEDPPMAIYVVAVPQSTTAHQASDLKYYRRYNFEALPMQDHEIRDVMNRATWPDATPHFASIQEEDRGNQNLTYALRVGVQNTGTKVIEHFKLEFTVPAMDIGLRRNPFMPDRAASAAPIAVGGYADGSYYFHVRSQLILLPDDFIDYSQELGITYAITPVVRIRYDPKLSGNNVGIVWRLRADNMPAKTGHVPFFPNLDQPFSQWPP